MEVLVCVLQTKLIFSTFLHPAQPVSVPMPPLETSCVMLWSQTTGQEIHANEYSNEI